MASTPSGGFPPSPAQAGRAASTSLERGSVDPVVVLVDCSGCRSRRESPGPSQPPRRGTAVGSVGSSLPASCSGSERVTEAGARRQSRGYGGGLSMILCLGAAARAAARRRARAGAAQAAQQGREHSSREGVLVSAKRRVFDETSVEAVPGGCAGVVRPKGRIGSREVATEGVRGYVASSARGRQHRGREVQRGGAFDRSSARTARHHAHRRRRGNPRRAIEIGCGKAEAGGSPSSEASPGDAPEATGRGWVRVDRRAVLPRGRAARRRAHRESGNLWGARVCRRLQKSERRIFLASSITRHAAGNRGGNGGPGRGSSKRPAIL